MWMNLNDMRIQGNGVYAVKQIRESHMTEYVPKLSYKTIMVDSELTNRNVTGFREMESQAKRFEGKKNEIECTRVRFLIFYE